MLSACASKPLAKLSTDAQESIIYEAGSDFDPSLFLSDIKEGTQISYEMNETEGKIIFTLSDNDKTETVEAPLEVKYPSCSIAENITVDKTKGYDLYEFITAEDGVKVEASFDEQTGIMTVTF